MKPIIYRIDFPDGDFYVGATCSFSRRREAHLAAMRTNKGVTSSKLAEKMRQHGIMCIYQVASGFSQETVHELEALYIELEQPTLNTNRAPTPLPPSRLQGATDRNEAYGPYPCLKMAAKALGTSYQTVKRYWKRKTFDELQEYLKLKPQLETKRRKHGPPDPRGVSKLVRFDDGWYNRGDVQKVSSEVAKARRRRGWSYEESIRTPLHDSAPQLLARVCRRHGIDPMVYYGRRRIGWTLHEALGLHKRPQPRKPKVKQRIIEVAGRSMPLKAWAKLAGVSPGVIHSRLSNGWTEAQAVGVDPAPSAEKFASARAKRAEKAARPPKPKHTVRGFTGTVTEIARHSGIHPGVVAGRKRLGWEPDEWVEPVAKRVSVAD